MFRQVTLPSGIRGRLYLHAMPGRHEPLASFVSEAQRTNLDEVICLATESEVRDKSPEYFDARSRRLLPVATKNFPIEEFGVPRIGDQPSFQEFIKELAAELRAGKALLIHCRMGIGRTGTVATCVLVELGLESAEALRVVKSAGSYPEVPEQKDLIAWYSSRPRE